MPDTIIIFDEAFLVGDQKIYGRQQLDLHNEHSEFLVTFSFSNSSHEEVCRTSYRAVVFNPLEPVSFLTAAATTFGLCVATRYTGSTLKIIWRTYGELKKQMPEGSARQHCVATFNRLTEKADEFKGEAISVLSSCSLGAFFPSD